MNQKKIGSFIKELRQSHSLTQEELAQILGVNYRTVSRWETARICLIMMSLLIWQNIFK